VEQLIAQITQRTGISEQQAREAIETVATYLKAKLPTPLAVQVDGLLSGQSGQSIAEQGQDMLTNLGGMFGKK
jgi:nucleoid DNA-binding protein